jgi:methylase of polypeptide subunit release factors
MSTATFVLKANTVDQVKEQIAEWILKEATAYRSKGRISARVHYSEQQMAIADAMEAAGKFILALKVEDK